MPPSSFWTRSTRNDSIRLVDESNTNIIEEETWLQGTFLSNFFFGIQITLSIFAFLAVLQRRTPHHNRMRIIILVYVGVLAAVTFAAQGLLLDWIQMGFITQRDHRGGPNGFFDDEYSIPVNLACAILDVCGNWMMECLLVWRCYVVCSSGVESVWLLGIAIPFLLLICVFVTGGLFIHFTLHAVTPAGYILAYSISSLVLNLTATGFIAARLLIHRRQLVRELGRLHGQPYVGLVAVVIESAATYTSFLLIVIVAYAVGSPATNMLQQVVEQIQAITSLLIILRIARGEGWSGSTETKLASAAVSSWNARVGQHLRQNAIQSEVVTHIHRDEEASSSIKEDERTGSLCKGDHGLELDIVGMRTVKQETVDSDSLSVV